MAHRHNHYEAAFEQFLRDRRIAYVAVDEARRSLAPGRSLKSLDYIVSPAGGPTWLVDVKGRLFPSGAQKRYWKNWSTWEDIRSLAQWEDCFGADSDGLFVFAYNIVGDRSPLPEEQLYTFRGRTYGFLGIRRTDYLAWARPISPRWETLAVPAPIFRRLALPVSSLIENVPEHAQTTVAG